MRPRHRRAPAAPVLVALLLASGCLGAPEDVGGPPAPPPTSTPPTGTPPPPPAGGPARVEVVDGELRVNGSAHVVRAVTFSPIPVGWREGMGWIQTSETYEGDLPLVAAMGANAVRLLEAPIDEEAGRAFLDAASANGLHVIMGPSGPMRKDSADPAVRNATLESVRRMVEAYGDHPAVLMWLVGNEVNYRYPGADVADWYTLLEECAALARSLDPNHPVGTANSDLKDVELFMEHAPSVDVFGTNHYNYLVGHYAWFMEEAARKVPGKAILVTEYGVDALNATTGEEYEDVQAALLLEHVMAIENGTRSIGVVVFSWVDEWWKVGDRTVHDARADWVPHGAKERLPDGSASEEWFGLVRQSPETYAREPREAYHALALHWGGDAAKA